MGSHILQSNDFIGFQHYSLPYILHQIGKLENELQHFNQTLACRPKSNCFLHHNISLPVCCVCNIFANCKSETLKGMWTIQWYYASVWCGWWPNYTICTQAWCGRLHIGCTNVSLFCLFDLRFGLFVHLAWLHGGSCSNPQCPKSSPSHRQAFRPRGCRECHGNPRIWQNS